MRIFFELSLFVYLSTDEASGKASGGLWIVLLVFMELTALGDVFMDTNTRVSMGI